MRIWIRRICRRYVQRCDSSLAGFAVASGPRALARQGCELLGPSRAWSDELAVAAGEDAVA